MTWKYTLRKWWSYWKRSTLVDHGLIVEENNTSNQKNKRKRLRTLPNLPVPPKRKTLGRRVGKGNDSHKYFTSINIPNKFNIATNLWKDFHNKTIALKNEKIIEKNNGNVNLNKFHTAIIPRLPFVNDISTTLLKNHCHSICFFRSAIARS